jgi:alpha-tubulin suppressor-like RCC1 family protein
MSAPSLKKRKAEPATPPSVGFSSPVKVERDKMISSRKPVSSPGKKRQSKQFLKDRESLYQQSLEALNENYIKLMPQALALSSRHAMLLTADHLRCQQEIQTLYQPSPGIVVSMGQDDCAQLGISTGNDEEEKLTVYPPTVVRNVTESMVAVAAGGLHSLALQKDGQVYTWGCNDDGALGRVTDNDLQESTAIVIDSSSMDPEDQGNVVGIEAGDSHSIYKTINGNVYMSGMYKDVDSGKFRDPPPGKSCKGNNAIPTKVRNLTQPVKTISCGASFNAAILADDSMVTWGTFMI